MAVFLQENGVLAMGNKTPVSILQEMLQKRGITPHYELIYNGVGELVPVFKYQVSGDGLSAIGEGKTKKAAKHDAAATYLKRMQGGRGRAIVENADLQVKEEINVVSPYSGAIKENCVGKLDEVRDRSAPVHSLIEALTCSECKAWAHSSKVFWCECRVICQSCKKKILNTTCNLCETTFAADARLVNFHMRVASTVHHPCRYQGCSHIVKPGVEHEDTCQYIPTKCFKCKKSIPTARLRQHFDTEHDKQVLTDNNFDVKYSYFTQVSQKGDIREIYCFAQGLLIPITLNKVDGNWDFIVSVPFINEAPSNITVTFEFKFKSYEFKREVKARNDLEDRLKIVDLPSDIFNDWNDGKCKLNISILVKRRRIAENKPAKKKRKITTEGGD